MELQRINLCRIEMFGGLAPIISELETLSTKASSNSRIYIDYCIIYFRALHNGPVNMQHDLIHYKDVALQTIDILKAENKGVNLPAIQFLTELIAHNVNYVAKVRTIN